MTLYLWQAYIRPTLQAENLLSEFYTYEMPFQKDMKTKLFMPSVTTEIGKLLDTSYYGLCIAWHAEMKKICDEFSIDFEKAVTEDRKSVV